MTPLIRLQASQGGVLYAVNPALVTYVQDTAEEGVCVVHFTGGGHVTVQAGFDALLAQLGGG